MERFYVVEVVNDLTIDRQYYQVDAKTAREAVDFVRDKFDDMDGYTVVNVFVEADEAWD